MISDYKVENGRDSTLAPLKGRAAATFVTRTVSDRTFGKRDALPVKKLFANRLLAAQPDGEAARLARQMQLVSFKPGEVIYQPESDCDYVYFPETAVFSQMSILENGKTVETAMIGSEGMLGLSSVLDFHPVNFWTQTLIGGSAYRMNARVFRQEFKRGELLQTAFLEYINVYIKQISQRAVCNNHHRIESRFSTWLLMLADRSRQLKLSLTQEQIAAVLGVQRPSVTCIAQNLRSHGIIEYIRGRIILNRRKLETAACECYAAVK